jgi:hypothetical protein
MKGSGYLIEKDSLVEVQFWIGERYLGLNPFEES